MNKISSEGSGNHQSRRYQFFSYRSANIASMLFMAVCAVLGIRYYCIPCRDVANRYAPMVEALLEKDWAFAFHLRLPPLQVLCGGAVALVTGCNAFNSLQIASNLWSFAGAAVLYLLMRELYPVKKYIAACSVALYAVFPYTFHMAYSGLRDSAKTTLLLLIAYALAKICHNSLRLKPFFILGIACGLGMIARAEMVVICSFCLFVAAEIESKASCFPWRTLIAALIAGAVNFGNVLINYHLFDCAMPDYRFSDIFTACTGQTATLFDGIAVSLLLVVLIVFAGFLAEKVFRYFAWQDALLTAAGAVTMACIGAAGTAPNKAVSEFCWSLVKGCYHAVGIFILLSVIFLSYYRKLRMAEKVILLLAAANILLCVASITFFHDTLYLSSRYIYATIPLCTGFFVLGIKVIYDFLRHWFKALYVNILLAICCLAMAGGFIFHMFQPILRSYELKRGTTNNAEVLDLTEVIANDYRGEATYQPQFIPHRYVSKKRPVVTFYTEDKFSVSAYLAGGSAEVRRTANADYYVGVELPRHLRRRATLIAEVKTTGRQPVKVWRLKRK